MSSREPNNMHVPEPLFNRSRMTRFFNLFGREQIHISIEGLRDHKLRSFLTMLGIIFGVAAVISMLAIGEGARRKTLGQIERLGLNNIIVKNVIEDEDNPEESGALLSLEDGWSIQDILPAVRTVVPVIEREYETNYKTRFTDVTLTGTEPGYFRVMNMQIEKGGYFSTPDDDLYQKVCVLGADAAKMLFLVEDPLGKAIKIDQIWFSVVGVLQYQPVSVAGNTEVNLNQHVFVPIHSAMKRFEQNPREAELDQIIVQIRDSKFVVSSAEFIEQVIFRRHNEIRNFELIVPEQLLRQSEETQKIFNIVMGAIAGISLLVGGIGIMNIMLASVLERTREIGIRRAMGATRLDIRNQFLIEAIILSLLGGIIGILIGYGFTFAVTIYSDWETAISLWSVLLSFGVSSFVGILFGYFPAKNAAELDPIEALRYE